MGKIQILFSAALTIITAGCFAQVCLPDGQYTLPGIYPDSTTGLPDAIPGVNYSSTLTVVLPSDTTVNIPPIGMTTLSVNYLQIDSIAGLPPGFTYSCEPSDCRMPGNSSGCVLISGTSTIQNYYDLVIYASMNATHPLIGTFNLDQSTLSSHITVGANPNTPIANFTTQSYVYAGQPVLINNTSQFATSYSWSFPGGSPASSTVANPIIVYNTPGTYTITLTATNANGTDIRQATLPVLVNAQPDEYYFNDTQIKEDSKVYSQVKYNNTVIIAGRSFDTYKYNPVIMRLDSDGNTLWTTADQDSGIVYNAQSYATRLLLCSDGYLYAGCQNNYQKQLWKIDPDDGTVIWKTPFVSNYGLPEFMFDYDADRFVITYPDDQSSGSDRRIRLAFVSKATGDTLLTRHIFTTNINAAAYGMGVDAEKNIYYTKSDSIIKIYGENPDSTIWRVTHDITQSDVMDYHYIYCDSTSGSVILMGRGDYWSGNGRIVKINPADGAFISKVNGGAWGEELGFRALKAVNDDLYIIWNNLLVGSVYYTWMLSKYNITSGTMVRDTLYNLESGNTPEQALSLDYDDAGNIYMAGYHNGKWSMMKVSGSTGAILYERTFTTENVLYVGESFGYYYPGTSAIVLNNQPCFIGYHPLESGLSVELTSKNLAFIKLNSSSGNIVLDKSIGGRYRFPSKTLAIKNYSTSSTLVMKQIGKRVALEMYDYSKNLVWQKYYSKKYYLLGKNIAVAPAGDIYIAACSHSETDTEPYYDAGVIDSIYVFHISPTGEVIITYSFYCGQETISSLDLAANNSGALVLYTKDDGLIYYRNIASSAISPEYNSQFQYYSIRSLSKQAVSKNDSTLLIFGRIPFPDSFTSGMIELNTATMDTIYTSIPENITSLNYQNNDITSVNYVTTIDADRVLLSCGKSNREGLCLYNTTSRDTIWTKKLSAVYGSDVIKCITDPQNNFIYALRIMAFGDSVTISKHLLATGETLWENNFISPSPTVSYVTPLDIAYDAFRNQLLVTGYETFYSFPGNKAGWVLVADTAGNSIDYISGIGNTDYENTVSCAHVLYDNSQWVGGCLNTSTWNYSGFIYEIVSGSEIDTTESCFAFFNLYPDTVPLYYIAENLSTGAGTLNYTWNWGDGTSDSTAYPSHSYDVSDNYTICLTISDSSGCTDTYCNDFSFKTESPIAYINVVNGYTGINAGESKNIFVKIYPNPSGNSVTIETIISSGFYVVRDITGKTLLQGTAGAEKFTLDISALSSGIYFIIVVDNEKQVVGKVIKKYW